VPPTRLWFFPLLIQKSQQDSGSNLSVKQLMVFLFEKVRTMNYCPSRQARLTLKTGVTTRKDKCLKKAHCPIVAGKGDIY